MTVSQNLVYDEKSTIPTVIDPTVELKNNIDESNEKIDINTTEIENMKCGIKKLEENQESISDDIGNLDSKMTHSIGNVYSYIRDTHNKIEEERLDDMTYIKGYIIKAVCLSSSVVFILNIIVSIIINFFK
jgi:chromosome segregation ATPase